MNNWNISSFVMNPSLFKSYTLKQNSIFSRRLPRRYRSRPMIHGSNLIIPSFSRSQQQNMRSTKVSSVITLNVLCNNSRKMVLSIPWQTFISFANSGVENRVSVRLRNISFISSYRNYRLIRGEPDRNRQFKRNDRLTQTRVNPYNSNVATSVIWFGWDLLPIITDCPTCCCPGLIIFLYSLHRLSNSDL